MANMSYCRFRNTLRDLHDCKDALDEGDPDGLDGDERSARLALIRLCKEIVEGYGDEVAHG